LENQELEHSVGYQQLGHHSSLMTRDPDTVLSYGEARCEREALNQEHCEGFLSSLRKKWRDESDPDLGRLPMSTTCLFALIFLLLMILLIGLIVLLVFAARLSAISFVSGKE
jgi:hypothetical protein